MRVLFTFIVFSLVHFLVAQSFTYSTDFGTATSGNPPNPWVIGTTTPAGVTNLGWTGGNIIFTGNPGGSYSKNTSNGNGTFTLSFTVPSNSNLSISNISFEARRTSTGPASIEIDVNGTSFVVTGSPGNGSFSTVSGTGSALNLTGTVAINITSSGGTGSNQNIRLDNVIINGVLPVIFSKISVLNYSSTSHIQFSTASETNNDFFSIERSADGRNFVSIGEIKGAGNSNGILSYEFVDEKPLAGINYYRIKQTDFDGKYSYSEIKSVRHISKGNLTVTPRTTEGRLQVVTDIDDYTLEVFNASGQLVKSFTTLSADQSISIDELVAGLYFVRIHHGSEVETVKITKI